MVKIHWTLYILIGAGVLFSSFKLDPKKFTVFIWLGYVFLAVGVAKLAIWFVSKKKETPREQRQFRNVYPQQQGSARFCYGCGAQLRGNENFCSMCGQRVRR